ncbi:hypothetical protein SAMN05216196_1011156 [Lutimaribacter pacificus]|uniref:Uncharacterized protein n=1 Tax=Lutimaribacter pacificus TaxID=391948 RepID=A0A1H0D1N4_9RHOB|nr:hypothetical protein [Lutimaribacter pacificus]SDN64038.1 hypothetical protein SAMN05216196_1011156 [Lutimaribacter pacificus]SHJ38058.1 hypothetical protein SAMN05444142_10161 [Lutimaribacter pacificus]
MQSDVDRYCHLAIEFQYAQKDLQGRIDTRIEALRPIRAVLSGFDFWQLQDHRRRCAPGGSAPRPLLAAYLRAKLTDAAIADTRRAPVPFVAGDSEVLCRLDRHAPCRLHLYHWTPPERPHPVSAGSWLGAALIGMAEGQVVSLRGLPGAPADRIEVLATTPAS